MVDVRVIAYIIAEVEAYSGEQSVLQSRYLRTVIYLVISVTVKCYGRDVEV